MTRKDLETFLTRKLNLSSFPIFSKIMYGVTDQNIFLELVEFLVLGYTTLEDLNNSLEYFDNASVGTFIINLKITMGFDKTVQINPTNTFNALEYLNKNDVFPSFLKKVSLNLKETNRPVNFFPYIVYNSVNGSLYTSLEDFKLSFEQNVTKSILQHHNIQNVSQLLPEITIGNIGSSTEYIIITTELTRLKKELLDEFSANFNNSAIFNFFISTPELPSKANSKFSKFTDLLAFEDYGSLSLSLFRQEIGVISNLTVLPPNNQYLLSIANRFKKISFKSSISNPYRTLEFLVNLVNCYRLNNQLGSNTVLSETLLSFLNGIHKLKEISEENLNMSASRLDIRN